MVVVTVPGVMVVVTVPVVMAVPRVVMVVTVPVAVAVPGMVMVVVTGGRIVQNHRGHLSGLLGHRARPRGMR
ncbi:hypothetical protein [Streptosporangium longisporum]